MLISNMTRRYANLFLLAPSIVILTSLTCYLPLENELYYKKIQYTNTLKILILGNSITGAPNNFIDDWHNYCGMSASVPEKDYVHLLYNHLADTLNSNPEMITYGLGSFERGFPTFNFETLDSLVKFNADLIIVRIGDNVIKEMATSKHYWEKYQTLLSFLCQDQHQVIICTSSWYANRNVDAMMKAVCKVNTISFIDISNLINDKSNQASSERQIKDKGVGSHPGDKGMAEIEKALWSVISKML